MIDIVRNPQNWIVAMVSFTHSASILSLAGLWFVPYFMVKFNYSRSVASLISGVLFISVGIFSAVLGKLSTQIKQRKSIIVICTVVLLLIEIVILLPVSALPMGVVVCVIILAGIGPGANPVVFAAVREYNWYYDCSDAAGAFVNVFVACSGVVPSLIIGELVDYSYSKRENSHLTEDGLREYTGSDYEFGFIFVHCVLIIGVVMSFFVKETKCQNVSYD